MEVSKVSDITEECVADYLRLDEVTDSDINTLTMHGSKQSQ
nr:MAG TPA: Swarming motility protein [Caudoviricetes sp.]